MIGENLLSIKEFSEYTGVKESTLRYYDKIGLFSPHYRSESDYRYYSPQQIITVNLIKVLSNLGMPLKTICELEINRSPEKILKMFYQQENMLDSQLRRLHEAYSIIHTIRNSIQQGLMIDEDEISVQFLEEMPLVLGEANQFGDSNYFYDTFLEFCKKAQGLRINLDHPVGGYFESMDSFRKHPGEPDHFFSIDPTGMGKRNMGYYLVAYTRGYYGELKGVVERLTNYAKEHQLTFKGPVYDICLHDELCIQDPNQYLHQLACQIDPRKCPGEHADDEDELDDLD
jgi:DNA-binding transcriptional MerR regulator